MSHVTTIDLEVKDLNALERAANVLGLELVRDQRTYKWWGQSVGDYPLPEGFTENDLGKCEHALRVKDNDQAYEIGITTRRDGKPGYQLLWDFYGGGYGLQAKVGEDGKLLKQSYAAEVAAKHLRLQGYRVSQTLEGDGRITLKAKR